MTKEAIDYVDDMLKLGYKLKDIKAELEKKGWSKRHVDVIIKKTTTLKRKEEKKSFTKYEQFIVFFGIAIIIIIVAWVSGSTNAAFVTVFASFLPTILTLITVYIIIERYGNKYLMFMFLVPLCWSGLLYVIAMNGTGPLQKIEISNVVLLNVLISVGIITFLNLIQQKVNPSK